MPDSDWPCFRSRAGHRLDTPPAMVKGLCKLRGLMQKAGLSRLSECHTINIGRCSVQYHDTDIMQPVLGHEIKCAAPA